MSVVGIFAYVLRLGVYLNYIGVLSCDILGKTAYFGFQKLCDGDMPFDITDSSKHALILKSDNYMTTTRLTFLKFSLGDTGVYRCKAIDMFGKTLYSQNMTAFVVKGMDGNELLKCYQYSLISARSFIDPSTTAAAGDLAATTGLVLLVVACCDRST